MRVAIIGANGQLGTDLVEVFGEEAIPLTHKDLDVTDFESLKILITLRLITLNFIRRKHNLFISEQQ